MEDILAGIKAYFESDLPAMLTTIGTERGVTVPSWKNLDTARIKDRQYPAIEIIPRTIEYEYGEEDGPFIEPIEYHNAAAIISQAGSEYKDVQNDLLRYVEGIRRITIDDDTYDSRFNWARLNGMNMGEISEAQRGGKLLQQVIVELRIRIIRG
jgi:hypothetical protein